MRKKVLVFLFFLFVSNSIYSAEFNIKLRKTEVNELKQQLMPAFEQNILLLNHLISCLEQGGLVANCLGALTAKLENKDIAKERSEQLKQNIQKKINDESIQQEQVILELKKFMAEVENVRDCLSQGQTANELKDCVVHYNKPSR